MSQDTPVQSNLTELLAGYLSHRTLAHAEGLASLEPEAEVLPYEAGPVQPIDAKLAWDETLYVAASVGLTSVASPPPHWSSLVAAHEPVVALACALGNFPQMVRHFHTILQSTGLRPPVAGTSRPSMAATEVLDWARKVAASKQYPQLLLAIGTLRLAKQFDDAAKLVQSHDDSVPAGLRTAWDNEKAALAWHQGQAEEASALWHRLEANAVTLFNRGMADLFLGRTNEAQTWLGQAIASLPEDRAWHHLARLYLTLARV